MKIKWLIPIVLLFAACDDEKQANKGGFTEPAIERLNKQIEKNPEDASLYFERGFIYDRLEKDSIALRDYKKAISLDSTKSEYYSAIGDMLFEHKDIEGSVPWIEKALELNPNDKKAHLKLAKMFLFIEAYNKAFSEINVVLRQDAHNPEGYYLKGMVYKNIEDTAKAISSLQTALQVDPEYRDAVIQLGILYGSQGDPIALKYYDNAFKMDTLDVFPIYAKGVYHQDKGSFERAKEEYRNAILKDNQYLNAYYNMGYIYMQQDSLQNAYRQYDIITKIQPQDAEAYFNRGLCSELMGHKEDAINDYNQALVFDQEYEDPVEGLRRLGAK